MIYLGVLGRLAGIKCPASQNVSHGDRYSFDTTLEGRVKAQAKPVARRSWTLQTSDATTPAQVSALMDIVNGAWGVGPFVFVSAEAPVTNLLSPRAGALDPAMLDVSATISGPVLTPAGRFGRSVRHGTGEELLFSTEKTSVLPGEWVTGSCYADGTGAKVRIRFFNGSGVPLTQATSIETTNPGAMTRLTVSLKAPATAAYCELYGVDGVSFAAPCITWTQEAYPYAPGAGCPKAVVDSVSSGIVLAAREPGRQYQNMSFTITEVG